MAHAALDVAADADLLLVNGSAPFGYDIAEAFGIPSAGLYWQPMTPTADFPRSCCTRPDLGDV